MSNEMIKLPKCPGCFGKGSPCPDIVFVVFGLTISLMGKPTTFPLIVLISSRVPVNASRKEIFAVYSKLLSLSLLNTGCGLSLIMNTISAGTFLGLWCPSFGNVIFVPSFHPFLTSISRIFCSSLVDIPSAFKTLRDTFEKGPTPVI